MGKYVLENPRIEINAVDFTNRCNEVGLKLSKSEIDAGTFDGPDVLPGQEENEISLGLIQDFAASQIDATLWPLWNNETVFTVKVRPDKNSAISATNPEYQMSCRLLEYEPLTGSPNDLGETSIDMKVIGNITRAVA